MQSKNIKKRNYQRCFKELVFVSNHCKGVELKRNK